LESNLLVDEHKAQDFAFTHAMTAFAVAAGMVGASLTAITVVQIVEHNTGIETLCDELLAGNTLLFLIGAICSFVAARLRFRGPWRTFHMAGDLFLLAGLAVMVASCVILVIDI
jgi:hypothetical protein